MVIAMMWFACVGVDAAPLPTGVVASCWLKPIPELGYAQNPCRLSVDLDGDALPDTAQLIEEEGGKKRRGILVRLASGKTARAGAGTKLGNGGDNFEWMDAWKVASRAEHQHKGIKGECLLVEKTEAASGYVCWDGKRLRWMQRGD